MESGTDNKMRLWDVDKEINTLVSYDGVKNFQRKGSQIAVSSNGELVYHPNGFSLSFSPSLSFTHSLTHSLFFFFFFALLKTLLSEQVIMVFEIFTGKLVNVLRGHYNKVNCCVFHSFIPVRRHILSYIMHYFISLKG
jgi:DNA excision repair protein ERCC-8